ncbi:MAG: hypothetical protein P8I91_08405 [Phycisphaerales bacterium]|nr:hypothetical protein [Phycisphaerales bacterium]
MPLLLLFGLVMGRCFDNDYLAAFYYVVSSADACLSADSGFVGTFNLKNDITRCTFLVALISNNVSLSNVLSMVKWMFFCNWRLVVIAIGQSGDAVVVGGK